MVDQIRHSGDVRVLDKVENLSQGGHHRRDLLDVIFETGVEARADRSRTCGLRTRERRTSTAWVLRTGERRTPGTAWVLRAAANIGDGVLTK